MIKSITLLYSAQKFHQHNYCSYYLARFPLMELHCIHSPTVSSIPRNGRLEKPFSSGHTVLKVTGNKRTTPNARRVRLLDWRCRTSGTSTIKSQANAIATTSGSDTKDQNLVFVAGATGKVGSRTVRELLKLGFRVRGGVRSIQRAESLVQSVKNMKLEDLVGGKQDIDKFEFVKCDLEKPDQIAPALGNSSTVICCIGASEKEIFDVTGPYRIDYQATKNLIDAATSAKVDHFILLTSLGTNKVGFPAAILNLFWGVLIWKRKAEEALLASGLPYTIVRPGGMERPTDAYKETHNITLWNEDTLFGGQVSNLQVAELMASIAKNRGLSYCKVLEVVAETTAPLTPLEDLLKKIPSKREQIFPSKKKPEETAVVSESILEEKEPEQIKATSAKPLSPYACYEDLKPPTSPTPTPSTGFNGSTKQTTSAAVVSTSPSVEVKSSEKLSVAVEAPTLPTEPKRKQTSSPYIKYHDLKPPSSPSPSVPILAVEKKAEGPVHEKTSNVNHYTPTKITPLSPYTMYEDLKPPSSPVPSPRK